MELAPPHATSLIAHRWRRIASVDEPSHADRVAVTTRTIGGFAIPNFATTFSLLALYVVRLETWAIAFALVPMILTVVGSVTLLPGAHFARITYASPRHAAWAIWLYAAAIGCAWSGVIGAIAALPIGPDRIGIACVTVAIMCTGGFVFALMPLAAVIFMAIVALRLSSVLTPSVSVPLLYQVAIVAFVAILAVMARAQAELFADRSRAALELTEAERRRSTAEARATEERHAAVARADATREQEREALARARAAEMADHAASFETSVMAVVAALGDVVARLGGSTGQLTDAGSTTRTAVDAIRGRAVEVATSMRDALAATDDLRAAIGGIGREVVVQADASAAAERFSQDARARAQALAERSREAVGVAALIDDIAKRTTSSHSTR